MSDNGSDVVDNIIGCSIDEIQTQIQYLAQTPVAGIARLLWKQQAVLKKGIIQSLRCLGTLKTEFGEMARSVPQATSGERKFRVAELLDLLNGPDCPDNALLSGVKNFISMDARGEVIYNVTLLFRAGEYLIKDGNKRTMAFYSRRRESREDRIYFPVYIVEVEGSQRARS